MPLWRLIAGLFSVACFVRGSLILFYRQELEKVVHALPLNKPVAWVLTAIDLAWVAYLIAHAPLGPFDLVKPYAYILAVVVFALTVWLMDEFLAIRAIGGFWLLLADPILQACRWYDSPWRLLIVVAVYFAVIVSIVLVLAPYRFRQIARIALSKPCAYVSFVLGILFALAGIIG